VLNAAKLQIIIELQYIFDEIFEFFSKSHQTYQKYISGKIVIPYP